MKKKLILLGLLSWGYFATWAQSTPEAEPDYTKPVVRVEPLQPQRVKEIAQLLPEKPRGMGSTYQDRAAWEALRATGKYNRVLKEATQLLKKDFPEWDNPTYMRMFTHGDSQSGKDVLTARLRWLIVLTWAECLENKGTYVPLLEKVIAELINQKTWVNPRNYDERNYGSLVELSTASYSHNLAQARYLLDDKLSAKTRQAILDALYTRTFNPIMATIEGKNKDHGWLMSTNNWNAVCLSGITASALAAIPEREERAKYVAIAERYSQNFVAGFLSDGYCTEGLSYYNYGFSRFITLRESIWQATQGKIDLFDTPKIQKIAAYGPNSEIIEGTYPAIADCRINVKPATSIMQYVSRTLGMGLTAYDTASLAGATGDLMGDIMHVFPHSATQKQPATTPDPTIGGLRSYFQIAGILTVRPAAGGKLGATLKGGKNNEHHNHNDLGSYTIAVGQEILMGDPGIIPYTAKTFGPERYTYKTIASYGHPVPLVAGIEQRPGAEAQAKILRSDFSQETDRFDMDLTSAYAASALSKLTRKFTYNRAQQGTLEVTDEFAFTSPQAFETALITRASWKELPSGEILLQGQKEKMLVRIDLPKNSYTLKSEEFSEEGGIPYTRIAIVLKKPVQSGTVKLRYSTL